MAPAGRPNLARRDLSSGGVFTLAFVLIAFVVLGTCFVWACVWPWLRRKYVDPSYPTRVRSTEGDEGHRSRRESILAVLFPSKDPEPNLFARTPPTELRTFTHRTVTPFSYRPEAGRSLSALHLTRKRAAAGVDPASRANGLRTTMNDQTSSDHEHDRVASPDVTSKRVDNPNTKSGLSDRRFGDAKEYILALPEPLALTPRNPQRTMTPATTLPNMFGSPLRPMDKHAHPNKLFRNLGKGIASGHNNPAPNNEEENGITLHHNRNHHEDSDSQSVTEDEGIEHKKKFNKESGDSFSIADMSGLSEGDDDDEGDHNPSVAAIHRLKTYRSLTGAIDPRSLTKSGTFTRAKTPVAEIRSMFDRTASEGRRQVKAPGSNDTFSSSPFTKKNGSGKAQSSSTNTSSFDFSASSLSLLPTPLSIKSGTASDAPPVPLIPAGQALFNSLPANREHAAGIHIALKNKGVIRKPASAETLSTRSRPAHLELSSAHQHKRRMPLVREVPSANSMLAPLVRPAESRNRFRSSSVYSRDTKGISMARSPISSAYGSITGRSPVSPCFPGDTTNSSDRTNLTHRKPSSPVDMVRNKVDNWHYNVADDHELRAAVASPYQDELDGPGPEVRHSYRDSQAAKTISVISTEYNAEEEAYGRMSMPRISVGRPTIEHLRHINPQSASFETATASHAVRQVTSDSALIMTNRGQAPGGAQWI